MLILTRLPGQNIMIGHNIVVTVLSIKGNQIRIGVSAPGDVEVHREEVYERIHGPVPGSMPTDVTYSAKANGSVTQVRP